MKCLSEWIKLTACLSCMHSITSVFIFVIIVNHYLDMPVNLSPRKSKQKMQKENILEANLRNLKFNACGFWRQLIDSNFQRSSPFVKHYRNFNKNAAERNSFLAFKFCRNMRDDLRNNPDQFLVNLILMSVQFLKSHDRCQREIFEIRQAAAVFSVICIFVDQIIFCCSILKDWA